MNSSDFVTETERKNSFLLVRLSNKQGKLITQEIHYFDAPKNLNLPETTIQKTFKKEEGKLTITFKSKMLAKDVFVEIPVQGAKFSDNFFDLLPGEKKVITITSPELKANGNDTIKVKHLRETY